MDRAGREDLVHRIRFATIQNNLSGEPYAMKIGYFAIGIGPSASATAIRTLAVNAERLGFATIWAPEHVVLLAEFSSRYPYSAGEFPMPLDAPIGDPFATLSYAAALTSKIRLATGICLVPEHNPVVLAKTVATVDYLSGGRLVLGTGIGWLAEEFEAIGVPWERRAHRTRECIESMRALWANDQSSYSGEFVNFSGAFPYGSAARAVRPCGASPNMATDGSASTCCPTRPRRKSARSRSC